MKWGIPTAAGGNTSSYVRGELSKGVGFRVWGVGFRVWGLGFRVYAVWLKPSSLYHTGVRGS